MVSGEGMRFDLDGEQPVLVDETGGWQMQVVLFASEEPVQVAELTEVLGRTTSFALDRPMVVRIPAIEMFCTREGLLTSRSPKIEVLSLPWPRGPPHQNEPIPAESSSPVKRCPALLDS